MDNVIIPALVQKIGQANGNDPRCLHVYFSPKTRSGKRSKKLQGQQE
jgi:hypothetical protein